MLIYPQSCNTMTAPYFPALPDIMTPKTFKLTTLTLLLTAFPAFAEDGEPAQTDSNTALAEVVVTGQNRSTRTENQNSYTTSAMRTTTGLALSPKETPQSVSVVTQTQLNDENITTLDEAMRRTTGINVSRDGGMVRFQSRGFWVNNIEEDGIATSLPGSSGNVVREAFATTDLAVYDHIEVVRGATGLTQNNGEPGGTINAVRKKPTSKFQADGDISINHRGSVRTTADVSGSLNEAQTVRGRVLGLLEHRESFRDRVDGNKGLIYGVMDFQPSENDLVTVGGLYQHSNDTPEIYGVPMGVGGGEAGLSRDTYLGMDWNNLRQKKTNLFAEWEHYFNDDWKLNAKANYLRNQSDRKTGYIGSSSTAYTGLSYGDLLTHNGSLRYKNENKQYNFELKLNGKYQLLGRSHDLFAGYSYTYQRSHSHRRDFASSTQLDPYTFDGTGIAEPDWYRDNPRYEMFYGTKQIANAFHLGTRFNPTDKLHIIGGTRYTRYKQSGYTDWSIFNYAPDSDPTTVSRLNKSRFTPYFGITYDLTPHQSLYASYTSIYKPVSTTDKQGKMLKPELGDNYEIGWKTAWFDNKLNTSLALFQINHKNRSVQIYDDADARYYNQDIGKVRSRGFEAEVSGRLTENWALFAGYTFNRSKYLEQGRATATMATGMNFSKHTPVHMLRLYTHYRLPFDGGKWALGGGVSVQSKTDSLYGVKQGGYAVWNANAQYRPNKHMEFGLTVDNLTDKRYYENNRVRTLGINNFYGEPRTVTAKFAWKF